MDSLNKIGLSLSGGGQRAAAFHLGVLSKLDELGLLSKINTFSTISGGSIIGAYYILNNSDFISFYQYFRESLKVNIIKKILLSFPIVSKFAGLAALCCAIIYFTQSVSWSLLLILLSAVLFFVFFFVILELTDRLNVIYDKLYYKGKRISDLPRDKRILLNATNLQTATLMTFTHDNIFDGTYIFWYPERPEFDLNKFPVSVAVAASSCFPPVFNPIKIYDRNIKNVDKLQENSRFPAIKPLLVDGGLYDNQGIYRIADENSEYRTGSIICSDGSAPYNPAKHSKLNPYKLYRWITDVLMRRIQASQKRSSVYRTSDYIKRIAYISMSLKYEEALELFAENVFTETVRQEVIEFYKIDKRLYTRSTLPSKEARKNENDEKKRQIVILMKKNINYEALSKNFLSDKDIDRLCAIKTSLDGLSEEQITLLEKHGAALTEIQLRLYCPVLLTGSEPE